MRNQLLCFGIVYIFATLLFAFVPNTFFNYGYNYYQFLPVAWMVVPAVLVLAMGGLLRRDCTFQRTWIAAIILVVLFPALCWWLRTRIHCFGGDGAVGVVVSPDFSLADWLPPFPGKGRLDGYASGIVAKCCRACGIFERSTVLTSILATQIYAVVLGGVFAVVALLALWRNLSLLMVLLTMPFAFNFFGNVDNYSFSLVMGLVILSAFMPFYRRDTLRFWHLIWLVLLWGIGMWTHPFHVFWGFPLSYLFGRWLRAFKPFAKLSARWVSVAFGLALFAAIKISPYGNHWFLWEAAKVPPAFSIDTLTHYVNMILLPALPLLGCLFIEKRHERAFKDAVVLFVAASGCFFTLSFTIGAVDQLNYQHLLFFIVAPVFLTACRLGLSAHAAAVVVCCNLSLLIPLVAVHSTDRTVSRAEYVYPMDPCQHNRVMSWQTHLGLCLGDNLQENPTVKRAVLRTFANGSRHAFPEGFRSGNYIYHTAFLYHFGEFAQGRAQLYGLLAQNPQVVRWFVNERPGFIYCNRKRLWDDIDAFLVKKHSPLLNEYRKVIAQLVAKCKREPYYLKRPSYAVTDY